MFILSNPIKFFVLSSLLFIAHLIQGQNYEVTFQVDMGNETISSNGVHIAGNFQSVAGLGSDWNPSSTKLIDSNGNNVFSLQVKIPAGSYEYKFINGNDWGMDESPPGDCSVGSTNNRSVNVGANIKLPIVPFNGCIGSVKLSVNMNGIDVSPNGVYVMGNFQQAAGYSIDWDPQSIMLEDKNADGAYEVDLMLPKGDYQYLFVNGTSVADAESLSEKCGILGENGLVNRTLKIDKEEANRVTYCFDSCSECDPNLNTEFKTHWWNGTVFYELFVRSFYDSDGDGIGDFRGAIEKLDYLNDGDPNTKSDLGITAIWLMPMMESPSYHGYDVTNYYDTEPDYGTMEDFEAFLDAAHARGIKVIIDLVLNHSSSQHPWFEQSTNKASSFRDWYVWSNTNPSFSGPWGQGVWHNRNSNYYYGLFWSGMPDLNYNHPPVKDEMFKVINFWLDKGVDGFRLDAIKYLIEEDRILENTSATFSLLEEFNLIYKTNSSNSFTIGEVWSSTASIVPYVQNERLDVCFEFDLASNIINAVNSGNASGINQQMQNVLASYPALQYGTFLTNHDMDRVYNQVGSNTDKMKLASSIYLTLPGIPFLYYGEEINMIGTGAHENIRRPMQWSSEEYAGFSTQAPWNKLGPNYTVNNVQAMEADSNSLLSHYKNLIHIRNEQPALQYGNYLPIESTASNILSYARIHKNEAVIVLSNLGTNIINTSLTLPASTLPSGTYEVTDLTRAQKIGSVEINDIGGFVQWLPASSNLEPRSTKILSLSRLNSVGISDLNKQSFKFKLYPNPTNDIVQIEWDSQKHENSLLQIYSYNGKKVLEELIENESYELQMDDWSSGIYFVHLNINGEHQIKKLFKL